MNLPSIMQTVAKAARQLRALARPADRHRGHAELAEMDERGLHDLGIGRGEIPYWLSRQSCDERGTGRAQPTAGRD